MSERLFSMPSLSLRRLCAPVAAVRSGRRSPVSVFVCVRTRLICTPVSVDRSGDTEASPRLCPTEASPRTTEAGPRLTAAEEERQDRERFESENDCATRGLNHASEVIR
jgi:hypothetical protein